MKGKNPKARIHIGQVAPEVRRGDTKSRERRVEYAAICNCVIESGSCAVEFEELAHKTGKILMNFH